MTKVNDDALQRRIARFVAEVKTPLAIRGFQDMCLGTNLGAVRQQNQDRALIAIATYPTAPEKNFALGVVSDGMGGLARGDEAAVLTISSFISRIIRTPRHAAPDRLRLGALAANELVYQTLQGRGGATLAAAMVAHQGIFAVNAGDSRIYGITHSREIKQLSRDDTLAAVLGQQYENEAHLNRLVQFIGMGEGIEPQIISRSREDFSSLLITSDGIHSAPSEIFAQVIRAPSINLELIRKLISLSDVLGARDNGTAIILPTKIAVPNGDLEQGLNLTFLSESDQLEIWIPLLAEESRLQNLPSSLVEASGNTNESRALPQKGRKGNKGPQRRTPRKKQRRSEEKLPLEKDDQPPLDIKFPEKSGT